MLRLVRFGSCVLASSCCEGVRCALPELLHGKLTGAAHPLPVLTAARQDHLPTHQDHPRACCAHLALSAQQLPLGESILHASIAPEAFELFSHARLGDLRTLSSTVVNPLVRADCHSCALEDFFPTERGAGSVRHALPTLIRISLDNAAA